MKRLDKAWKVMLGVVGGFVGAFLPLWANKSIAQISPLPPSPGGGTTDVPTQVEQTTTTTFGGEGGAFTLIVNWVLLIAGSIAVIVIIYAGLQYLFAGTNTELKDKAKNTLTYAVIGIIVILLAFVIVNLIGGIFTQQ